MKAFIARDKDGRLFLYSLTPSIKTELQWISLSTSKNIFKIDDMLFPEVKWEDKEPTEINIEIVNQQQ